MPSIDFDVMCDACGKTLSATVVDRSCMTVVIHVEPCGKCIDKAVEKEQVEGKQLLVEAVKQTKNDIDEHWNAILNTGAK